MCRMVRYEAMARVGVLVQLLVVYDGRLGACVISKVVATFNGERNWGIFYVRIKNYLSCGR